jgi:hypothetical protein
MPGNKIRHDITEEQKNTANNRKAHSFLKYRFTRRGHKDPGERANHRILGLAAHDRHQAIQKSTTGRPENMANYEPGGIQYSKKPAHKFEMNSESEDEFGGGRRRRRTRRHRKSRRHTRKH